MIFQNESHFYYLCTSVENGKQVIQLLKSTGNTVTAQPEVLESKNIESKVARELLLKIKANGDTYSFYYATQKNNWQLLKGNVDGKFLSTKLAGGFVGCMYAMYATSNGIATTNKAYFNWFECSNNDDVYKKIIVTHDAK
jgi:alpha-N-arabinofuranosidase